ncbi:MAG: class I tRNA ligase family protein [Candidatus Absconditabacterales bacterium]
MVKLRLYKPELFKDGESKKLAGQWTLYNVYYAIIRLIAPYMPHVTEEIYHDYFKQFNSTNSLHLCSYPEINNYPEFQNIQKIKSDFGGFLNIVEFVRKYKTEKQISMGAELEKLIIKGDATYLLITKNYIDDLIGVTKGKDIQRVESNEISYEIG